MKCLTIILALFLTSCTVNTPVKEPPQAKLATFKSEILDKASGRLKNIELCVNAINGKTIAPGEVFSFNETVGPRTKEKGYKRAKVLVQGEYKEEYGGGVCQVSTAVYNSALLAGLEIAEHHTHEKPVAYIEKGRDATISYGTLDLKIKNNTDRNVRFDVRQNSKEIISDIINI